jgi:hypothetical protein
MQKPQPLGRHLLEEIVDAGRVAARPGEARDKTKVNRVFADTEDDRDRRCCSFGRKRSDVAAKKTVGRTAKSKSSKWYQGAARSIGITKGDLE